MHEGVAREAFLCACELDVRVRKPGNVSLASPGHGMQAEMFIRSARAAAAGLFAPGARVGARIEAAQAASWAEAGCNTNLGILLLCAPIAAAAERCGDAGDDGEPLHAALKEVLDGLDVDDTRAAYRAIAAANPGGLGSAPAEDVHSAPSVNLRTAMALAAERDSIARQYRGGFADLFDWALPALGPAVGEFDCRPGEPPGAAMVQAVQRLYLTLLARLPDSHIVRKHGEAVAHTVMRSAQGWRARAEAGEALDADPGFASWDEQLKARGLNPGTTADLTVATLMLAGLVRGVRAKWHGS
ncbi:triphosphoribosyl-dephospho-CoA synthase [Ideonella sp. YS5]|uniref:triphosphoribosyl-dephospho-CoA synthase n=1 Tax=Ideonella sp. YS5 TaxID=3453714 RepID=UPI003EF0366F